MPAVPGAVVTGGGEVAAVVTLWNFWITMATMANTRA
jgi:hypothetical protein